MSVNKAEQQPYDFFFHPFKMLEQEPKKHDNKALAIFAVFTHVILTIITAGFWQIPFWLVDYFEGRKIEPINKGNNSKADLIDEKANEILLNNITKNSKETESKMISPDELIPVFEKTPKFNNYQLSVPASYGSDVVLTGMKLRPSNLFLRALFGKDVTTMPGGGLFKFLISPEEFEQHVNDKADDEIVSFNAKGVESSCILKNGKKQDISDLSEVYGDKTYSISYGEIKDDLKSQKIYTSTMLPLIFYEGLKKAMAKDKIVVLPGNDANPITLSGMIKFSNIKAFILEVKKNPEAFGFKSISHLEKLLDMTIYQIGAMVVKSEDYHIFLDGEGKIRERTPGANDAIRLINACGIRGIMSKHTPSEYNKRIMTETFRTALLAAKDGFVTFPAVGMGIWRGDPEVYWPAFFDAVALCGEPFESILVNPNHQKTASGNYAGCMGEEFEIFLNKHLKKYQGGLIATENLRKIINLSSSGKDLVQLAYELKQKFPDKNVSLFNASDPDVTLGYHVGEYVNNCPHANTTEENYSALGSNVICFETHTKVHEDPTRLFQVYYAGEAKFQTKNLKTIMQAD